MSEQKKKYSFSFVSEHPNYVYSHNKIMLERDWQQLLAKNRRERGYWRARFGLGAIILLLLLTALGIYHSYKTLPAGLNYASSEYLVNLSDLKFLRDRSFREANGTPVRQQEIFDTLFAYLDQASQYVLLDFYLFNDLSGGQAPSRDLAAELTTKLLAKKEALPEIKIDVLIDPLNTAYGGRRSPELQRLSDAGINVIVSDVKKLRDTNPWYAAPWRLLIAPWGNSLDERASWRSYLAGLNRRANHRQVFLADNEGRLVSIITTANPAAARAADSNVALVVKGIFGQEIYQAAAAAAAMSGSGLNPLPSNLVAAERGENYYAKLRFLTEGQIKRESLEIINDAAKGSELLLTLGRFSEREIIKALAAAAERGAVIKIILDPNAWPNRFSAADLLKLSANKIVVRWYDTGREEFHPNLLISSKSSEESTTWLLSTADFTRSGLDNFNLGSGVKLSTRSDLNLAKEARGYWQTLWDNAAGARYTLPHEHYRLAMALGRWWCRFLEASGWGAW